MANNDKNMSFGLSQNKHFLIALMSPYIFGAKTQLIRTMEAHAKLRDKEMLTMTGMYTFVFEASSLLEHLSMIQHLLHNADIDKNDEISQKILDIRNELRHGARYDDGKEKQKNTRAERIGKNDNMVFQLNATRNGIQCANIELTFNEIDMFINRSELLMYGTLSGCTIKIS